MAIKMKDYKMERYFLQREDNLRSLNMGLLNVKEIMLSEFQLKNKEKYNFIIDIFDEALIIRLFKSKNKVKLPKFNKILSDYFKRGVINSVGCNYDDVDSFIDNIVLELIKILNKLKYIVKYQITCVEGYIFVAFIFRPE